MADEKVLTLKDLKEQLKKVEDARSQCETSYYQLSGQVKLLKQQIVLLEDLRGSEHPVA